MRKFRVTGSWGVYDAYKWLRRRKWQDTGQPLTEHQFYTIVREVNKALAEEVSKGRRVTLPHRMGALELVKRENRAVLEGGRLKTTYPVDWGATERLWQEDEESRIQKRLVKYTDKHCYRTGYFKGRANYGNKAFYRFFPVRALKLRLKEKIQNKETDAIW